MQPRKALRLIAIALFLSVPAGCGSTSAVTSDEPDASIADLEALYHARRDSARMQFTEADVDFMTGMIAHHAQALVMSRLAPTNAADDQVKTLAARIINAQNDEIATMQGWLGERGKPIPEIEIDGIRLTVHGAGDHAVHMPGMLTHQQLKRLAEAQGAAFDRLFIEYMIEHHRGAVTMVHHLFNTDGAAQGDATFKIASDIQVDQLTEIARMELMLEELRSISDEP